MDKWQAYPVPTGVGRPYGRFDNDGFLDLFVSNGIKEKYATLMLSTKWMSTWKIFFKNEGAKPGSCGANLIDKLIWIKCCPSSLYKIEKFCFRIMGICNLKIQSMTGT